MYAGPFSSDDHGFSSLAGFAIQKPGMACEEREQTVEYMNERSWMANIDYGYKGSQFFFPQPVDLGFFRVLLVVS